MPIESKNICLQSILFKFFIYYSLLKLPMPTILIRVRIFIVCRLSTWVCRNESLTNRSATNRPISRIIQGNPSGTIPMLNKFLIDIQIFSDKHIMNLIHLLPQPINCCSNSFHSTTLIVRDHILNFIVSHQVKTNFALIPIDTTKK